uniref:Putative basic tail protein n=1 Tax=Ixodes ricinus TaxID=34613 RepID=A0A0K8RGV4_IXORI
MIIQALRTFAVVAVFPLLVNCAPEENATMEDRTCAKRDADAKQVTGPVESCSYYCQLSEEYSNYVIHYYPDLTPCQYGSAKTSKCMDKLCRHPEDDIFKKEGKVNPENKEEGEKEEKEEDEGGENKGEENEEEENKKEENKQEENKEEENEEEEKKEDENEGEGTEDKSKDEGGGTLE